MKNSTTETQVKEKQDLNKVKTAHNPVPPNSNFPDYDVDDFREMTLDELNDILSLTIRHDKNNKLITFLAMLSAFTDSSQLNVSFNAPLVIGKDIHHN